jgi:UDP:flavonoid glycosyltransferase YjiC (YdhE family)
MAYVAASLTELTGIKWISTSLSPISFFSAEDPPVAPGFEWFENLRFLGTAFHKIAFGFAKNSLGEIYEPYREFRRELGLEPDHDPIFADKFSNILHLAMFSKALAKMQPDWPSVTLQSGFAFFDDDLFEASDSDEIDEFLDDGEPPVVFTLGSAAAMVPGDFFNESIGAAQKLGRRAIVLYGKFTEPPNGIGGNIAAFNYAPYSKVFPRAACVVHQGGVGTTGQALSAGVPQVIVPFANDQPDNAARCRRAGYGEVIRRQDYTADEAAAAIEKVLADPRYTQRSFQASRIIAAERGTATACDAIETVLNTTPKPLK